MPLRSVRYFAVDGFRNFLRNGINSFISVCTISFSLFLLGVFLLISRNIKVGIESLENSIPIFVFFSESTDVETIKQRKENIERKDLVNSVQYISSSEALRQFVQGVNDTSKKLIVGNENPFPPFLEVYPKREHILNRVKIKQLSKELSSFVGVESVEYDAEWAVRIEALVKIWDYLIYFVGFALFIIVAFIISTSVDLSIQNHRREMEVLSWVGGSYWAICMPFVVEGIIIGGVGGALSLLLLNGFFIWFLEISSELVKTLFPGSLSLVFLSFVVIFKIILVAVSVGALGAFISARRQINDRNLESYR